MMNDTKNEGIVLRKNMEKKNLEQRKNKKKNREEEEKSGRNNSNNQNISTSQMTIVS